MKTKILHICIFTCFTILATASSLWAVDVDMAKELVNNYTIALKSKNVQATTAAWKKISQEPEVVQYVRLTMPKKYQSLKYWSIRVDLENLQNKYSALFSTPPPVLQESILNNHDLF